MLGALLPGPRIGLKFQRQENEVKECGLKTVNEVRASNFLAGAPNL